MVRKYSSKRPEVITFATENTAGVFTEDLKARLSGKSHDHFGLSMGDTSNVSITKRSKRTIEEGDGLSVDFAGSFLGEQVEADDSYERFISEDVDGAAASDSLQSSSSQPRKKSGDFWESVGLPSADELLKDTDGNASESHEEITKDVGGSIETAATSLGPRSVTPKTAKPPKQNKWKPEEINKLIKKRSELDSRFKSVKSRMVLWVEISTSLLDHGINRSPAQCKSLWVSPVQKYEELRADNNKAQSSSTINCNTSDEVSNTEAVA